jgi:hypothetical protein
MIIFLKFITELSKNLINYSMEYAFIISIEYLSDKEKKAIGFKSINENTEFINFELFLIDFFKNLKDKQFQILSSSFLNIFRKNQRKGSEFLKKVIKLIEKHQVLSKKQQVLLQSAKYKSKFYKILVSIIIGTLTPLMFRFQSIYYIISSSNFLINDISFISQGILGNNYFFFIIYSLSMLLISLIAFNKTYDFNILKIEDLIFLILYLSTNLITNTILSNLWII